MGGLLLIMIVYSVLYCVPPFVSCSSSLPLSTLGLSLLAVSVKPYGTVQHGQLQKKRWTIGQHETSIKVGHNTGNSVPTVVVHSIVAIVYSHPLSSVLRRRRAERKKRRTPVTPPPLIHLHSTPSPIFSVSSESMQLPSCRDEDKRSSCICRATRLRAKRGGNRAGDYRVFAEGPPSGQYRFDIPAVSGDSSVIR